MKTIEQCKNEIAIVNNFDSFKKAIRYTFNRELLESEEVFINKIIGEAMEQYAQEQVKNLTIPVVINWVAVKDELPETDKRVLCARAETSMGGRKRISNAIGFVNKNGKFSCEMDWVDVDYWADIKPPCL